MNFVVSLAVCSGLILSCSFAASSAAAFAGSDLHIHGVVRDSASRAPLHGASVRVVGTSIGAIADRYGAFDIHNVNLSTNLSTTPNTTPNSNRNISGDSLKLRVSYVGYAVSEIVVYDISERDGSNRATSSSGSAHREVRVEILMKPLQKMERAVEVIGTRIVNAALPAQQATVLDEAAIDEHRGQTFADALTQVPGVTLVQTGAGIKKPMINGMTGTRLVLRNNNVVQEGQQWGMEHAPEIDALSPVTVTVVKGPAAVKFGPNALGGVIDIESRPIRTDSGMHGEATMNLFSNGGQGALGAFVESSSIAGLPVALRAQASARVGGDAAAPDYMINNTGVREINAALTTEVGDGNTGARVVSSYFSTTLGIFQGAHIGNATDMLRAIERGRPAQTSPFTYAITNPRQEVQHSLLSVRAFHALSATEKIIATAGYQVNDRSEFDAHNIRIVGRGTDPVARAADSLARLRQALATPAMNLLLSTGTFDAQLDHSLSSIMSNSSSIRGSIGVASLLQVNDRSGSVMLIPDYRLRGLGAFVYEALYLENLTISAGMRYDTRHLSAQIVDRSTNRTSRQDRSWASATAGLGAVWSINDKLSLSSNVSSAWRPPQVNELYSNDVHHGSAIYEVGDSTLSAERARGADVGVQLQHNGFGIDASVYISAVDNFIMSLPDVQRPTITVRGTFPTYVFTQMNALFYGSNVSLTVPVTGHLSVNAIASAVRARNSSTNRPLMFIPADRIRTTAHIHTEDVAGLHDTYVDVSLQAVRRQDNVVAGTDYAEPPPGYLLADIQVGGVVATSGGMSWRVSVACANIFNTAYRDYLSQYRYFSDDPGRNVTLRLTTSF